MKTRKNCQIIQDLLPNYIDKLTNQETNEFIEKHLEECEECKKIYQNMENKTNNTEELKEKKAVNYFKKYKNKLKFVRILLLIVVLIFLISTIRKMFILSKLSYNAENIVNSSNYHKITYNYERDNYIKLDIYKLDQKIKMVTTKVSANQTTTQVVYGTLISRDEMGMNKYNTNVYFDDENGKTARLNMEATINVDPQNVLEVSNLFELFLGAISSHITSTTYDGEKCYDISINEKNMPAMFALGSSKAYFSKKTGLQIVTMGYDTEFSDSGIGRIPPVEYVYEFDNVTPEEFEEPDINEYTIK